VTLVRFVAGRRLLAAGLAVALAVAAWAAWMWVRDVSILRVKHVEIEGASGRDAPAIKRALRQTGLRMTTLHVRDDELEHAVDRFLVVQSVSASVDFPNTLRITVNEHDPVAVLVSSSGRRISVSASGVMLSGVSSGTRLPEIEVGALNDARKLEGGPARTLVGVVGGAPEELRHLLTRAWATRKGVRVAVRDGPVIDFGKPVRIAAKWAAATRVLADAASSGAGVLDVRLPERPAARGDGLAAEETEPTADAQASAEAAPAAAAPVTAVQEQVPPQAPAAGTTGTPTVATGPTAGGTYTQP
jgi:hypothetical protein